MKDTKHQFCGKECTMFIDYIGQTFLKELASRQAFIFMFAKNITTNTNVQTTNQERQIGKKIHKQLGTKCLLCKIM